MKLKCNILKTKLKAKSRNLKVQTLSLLGEVKLAMHEGCGVLE